MIIITLYEIISSLLVLGGPKRSISSNFEQIKEHRLEYNTRSSKMNAQYQGGSF